MSLLLRLLPDSILARKYVHAAKNFSELAQTIGDPIISAREGTDGISADELGGLWKKYNSLEMEYSRRGYKTIEPDKLSGYCDRCINDVPLNRRNPLEEKVLHSISILKTPKVKATIARYQPHSLHFRQDKTISSPGLRR